MNNYPAMKNGRLIEPELNRIVAMLEGEIDRLLLTYKIPTEPRKLDHLSPAGFAAPAFATIPPEDMRQLKSMLAYRLLGQS